QQFRNLPESIVKEHLLPFLCHESWYNGHQFCFEQLRGAGAHMLDRGSWKHAAFQWAEDVYHLAGTNRAKWNTLGRVSQEALANNLNCHTLFLGDAVREVLSLQGLSLNFELVAAEVAALRLLPKEAARRSILTRYKVAKFQRKLLVPRSIEGLEREFRSFSQLVHEDLVEEPVQPDAHEFCYDDGSVDVVYWPMMREAQLRAAARQRWARGTGLHMHDKPVSFNARRYHTHEGSMWALAAYVPQAYARATEQHRQALREAGFPLPA
ncbi:unnamed protein product, partial [Symbiodinium necroappetens]